MTRPLKTLKTQKTQKQLILKAILKALALEACHGSRTGPSR